MSVKRILITSLFCSGLLLPRMFPSISQDSMKPEQVTQVTPASLIQLISSPEKFDGKTISVIGVVRLEFEGNRLYLSRSDYQNRVDDNGIWIRPSKQMWDGRAEVDSEYVHIVGIFEAHAADQSHQGSGIREIKRWDLWPPPEVRRHDLQKRNP